MRGRILGLNKLQKRLSDPTWVTKPTGAFLRDWREDLRKEAEDRAPRWRGGIIRALQSQQDTSKFPLYARVFSDAPEARWSEYGTGLLSDDPKSSRRRYFPPVNRVRDWSQEHSIEPYVLARSIHEKGGTPPTHFFSDAERSADARLNEKMQRWGRNIEAEAGRAT